MTPVEKLIASTAKQREAAHRKVDKQFDSIVGKLRELQRKPGRIRNPDRVRRLRLPAPGTPFDRMKTIQAAHAVLSQGTPMTLVELAVAVRNRGHRPDEEPRTLMRSLREALRYHRDKFGKDSEGRWFSLE